MKNLLVILFLFATVTVFAQGSTRTVPQYHHWQRIYDGIVGDNGDGIDTTDAFSPLWWEGVTTLAIATDTTGYDTPDSCLTIYMQVKRKYTYPGNQVVDQDWMGYYDGTDITRVKIDTVARSFVNAENEFYINPAAELSTTGEWAWGDSIRFIVQIGTGDSLGLIIDVGGQ